MAQTLYDILQVHPRAETEVINAAAKALMVKHSVDRGGDTAYFQALSEAKVILGSEAKRKEYDREIVADEGELIGNYRLVRKMTEGGFGEIYEARHEITGMKACVKMNLEVEPIHTDLFLKEAKALWDLRHHALPAVRDMCRLQNGKYAMVMSFIEGPTLEQLAEEYRDRGETIDPENVCWIMDRVLDALRYMHYRGIIHGDVKPQNIIIQRNEHTAALVDFGLASVKPQSGSYAVGHTPYFASPEHMGNRPLLPESDLYSLGLTMIYALGGDPKALKVPKNVPAPVREFISDLIVYDIFQRPHWQDVDLVKKLREVRLKAFGRENSGNKKL
jgi:serine/threonine protein kinase